MSIQSEMNIVDQALASAIGHLAEKGMPDDEARIALLIRLWSTVPPEISEIAEILRADEELDSVINAAGNPGSEAREAKLIASGR
jgi:hypothetical protein